ncbi:MAG: hypothetical protein ACI8XC_002594, partial [Gammaproteobacteria bacterium]
YIGNLFEVTVFSAGLLSLCRLAEFPNSPNPSPSVKSTWADDTSCQIEDLTPGGTSFIRFRSL